MSLEMNLPRKPPRSNVPLLRHLVPSLETTCESEIAPSLKGVITVDNAQGRINASSFKAFSTFPGVLGDGAGRPQLSEDGLSEDDVVNIQFTRSAIVFPSESFDPFLTLKAVQEEKCTALYGVPTMFTAELELLQNGVVSDQGFQYLRTGIIAGSSVPTELMRKLHKKLNLTELTICYGMTETSPVSAMTTTDDPLVKRVESVGRLLPHVEAKVVSATDRSEILPIGKRGELVVSGYLLQKGYWNDPARTAEVMVVDEEGKRWIHTGDEAEMDAEGYIKITGRLKDLIIRGGENIYPLEIENCLLAHLSILEASAVGLRDKRYGEVVAVFVRKDGSGVVTQDDVKEWVRVKLSHHLVPKYVFFVTEYPKTASGKIQKFVLQEMGERLALEKARDIL
ncbi:GTPase activating protein (GAP) [Maublancomyces gigas]|uniref:GTPase activating protein (GAP) n=1 Tax=Discina gigas TaxID=1032678 RepID=A0ABR3GVB2_9PEZI